MNENGPSPVRPDATQARSSTWRIVAAIILLSPIFFVFTFNSGYGYDQLEYLLVGRLLSRGHSLYEYAVSKSPGIFFLTAALQSLGVSFGHWSLSAVITAVWAVMSICTYVVFARWHPPATAGAAAFLTALSGFFCELNFLQPTVFFYLCGLFGYDQCRRFVASERPWHAFACGAWIAAGVLFKTTSLFYGLGAAFVVLAVGILRRRSIAQVILWETALAAGAAVTLLVQYLVALTYGVGSSYLEWTYVFPLLRYPPTLRDLPKLYSKLAWIHVVFLAGFMAWAGTIRRHWRDALDHGLTECAFGVAAYLALLKVQASHYAFAGIPFLFMFSAGAMAPWLAPSAAGPMRGHRRRLAVVIPLLLAMLLVGSVLLYRPSALQRITTLRSFAAEEEQVRDFLQRHVEPGRYTLLMSLGMAGYWIADRVPPPPFINMDAKSIWCLRNDPERFYGILDDPRLDMVQFNDSELDAPILEGVETLGEDPRDRPRLEEFRRRLAGRFDPIDESIKGCTFWRRGPHAAETSGAR